MKNKTLGTILLSVLGLGIVIVLFETSMSVETSDTLYMIFGLGMYIFGIWAGVRLYNQK
jgi:hypothetical protein